MFAGTNQSFSLWVVRNCSSKTLRRRVKEGAIPAFEKLINQDKVLAILGPTLSNSALAADPIAQDKKSA